MDIHRGRLLDHVSLVVADFQATKRFYLAVLAVLGIPVNQGEDWFEADELFVSDQASKSAAGVLTGRMHLAFVAASREVVERFHREGLAAGGRDNGPPGERQYHPGYYGAFLLDPAGNNIEAVHHGVVKEQSADAVLVRY